MINHAQTYQGKRSFWFQAFTCLLLKELKLTQMIETKGIAKKISSNLVVRNLQIFMEHVTLSQLVVTLSRLQFFKGRYKLSKYHEKHGI